MISVFFGISQKNINEVSGGEKQKTYLSRVMSVNPEVIIMDEPSQNLDNESNNKFIELIIEEKNNNKTIIIASHDFDIVKKIADKLIILDFGKVSYDGVSNIF